MGWVRKSWVSSILQICRRPVSMSNLEDGQSSYYIRFAVNLPCQVLAVRVGELFPSLDKPNTYYEDYP